jgi:FkbM family methyltransferase
MALYNHAGFGERHHIRDRYQSHCNVPLVIKMRNGLIGPVIRVGSKHCYRLLTDAEYRRSQFFAARYARTQRYTERRLRVHGWNLIVPDMASFVSMYRQIFCDEMYLFRTASRRPRIIDCGANIGLSVLWFKMRYPEAEIVAFEPDPHMFSVLQQNIRGNAVSGVKLINKALWSHATSLPFRHEGADASRVALREAPMTVRVEGVPLSNYLSQPVEMLKIDIEGSEVAVVRECEHQLANVEHVFMEYHSFVNQPQGLGELLTRFKHQGFRFHVRSEQSACRPFVEIMDYQGMDLQLSLFFTRNQPPQSGIAVEDIN